MKLVRRMLLAAAILGLPALASAHHEGKMVGGGIILMHHVGEIVRAGAIAASHGWTEETGETAHGIEVFVTIENSGSEPDRLVSATTEFADDGMFEASVLDNTGTLVVKQVSAIELTAGQIITFQPGSLRIVFQDVKQRFLAGDHFHMTLTFDKAGPLEIEVEVEHDHGDGDDHDVAS
ncbi:MAG: copper chaperone PCu(A)C [Geminicoccaceae bacterium]